MAPSLFFHPFQPTRNNQQHCGCYTSRKKKKIPHKRVIPGRTSVRSDSLVVLGNKRRIRESDEKKKNAENRGTAMWDQDPLLPDPALTLT